MTISPATILNEYATKTPSTGGTYGFLTADQQRKTARLWQLIFQYLDSVRDKPVKVVGELLQKVDRDWSELGPDEPGLEGLGPEEITRPAAYIRIAFGSKKTKLPLDKLLLDRHVNETTQQYLDRTIGRPVRLIPDNYFPSFKHPDNETRNLADMFWTIASSKMHPDIWLHRYLRAMGWDVDRAFGTIKSVLEWRAAEAADRLNYEGDITSGLDEFRLEFCRLVGRDRLGYLLYHVTVRNIMPRATEPFVFKRYLITIFEGIQSVTRGYNRATMIYDFTGFSLDNTPFQMVHFMVTLGMKQYADSTSMIILLVDSWLFSNFWNLIRPFLDANLGSRIVFAKNADEVMRYVDRDQLPVCAGGTNEFSLEYRLPQEGENAAMFDTEGRRAAEQVWRDKTCRLWVSAMLDAKAGNSMEEKTPVDGQRDAAAQELFAAELKLSKFTYSRNVYHRHGMVDETATLKF
ncbi:CRAL/TRIO domain-containing protein [Linderina pennispora]|uniref:CRAL/TRIO domain-containing protein n=1 Tax=Linderina pennispora TaxID=61395 RepID=A0A1Y1W037_9FUNG|nr:CRAL/TRIO domain-containing protein [Linderina pennispora]ORX66863.1 CRAL/TRIO domain-containing protein [Linderina pennispora]